MGFSTPPSSPYLSAVLLRRRSHDSWGACHAWEVLVPSSSICIVEVYRPTTFFTSIGTKKKEVIVRTQRDIKRGLLQSSAATGATSLIIIIILDGLGGISNLARYLSSPRWLYAFAGDWRRVAPAQIQSTSYNSKGGCNTSATLCGLYCIG